MRIQLQSIPFRLFLFLLISITLTNSEPPVQEKDALLSFIHQVPHASRYEWNSSTSPCDWPGISCDASRSSIITLRLPGAGLIGKIPSNTLSRLSHLRVLSLHYNRLSGPIPSDFSNLTSLRGIYLGNNRLTGEFPLSLTSLTQLNRIDLSNNEFTGAIPVGINNLTNLNRLYLQNNNFSGEIPNLSSIQLSEFNVSNNKLNGSIPKQLSKFPESSFKGNLQLCGPPLTSICNSTLVSTPPSPDFIVPSSPAERNHKKLSTAAIAAIAVAAAVVLLILLICLFFCFVKRRRRRTESRTPKSVPVTTTRGVESGPSTVGEVAGTSSSKDDLTSGGGVDGERNKLVFINNGIGYSFDLEDLLRASAEVLGKGSVGTSYKAVLEEGTTVVVKRLKDVVAAKREFEVQMEVIGGSGCRHENVVPLRAYYFSKDEKLLVSDYFPAGSLSALLHGSRGSGRSALDWESRMKVATGVGRGLSHLHLSGRVVHGNIKSSNVLLRQQGGNNNNNKIEDGCLSDYGLNPLFGNSSNPNRGVSGYRAPEVFEARKVTFKSDVYSFGVLLLELLTGKAPNQASLDEEGIDLPRWVQSVVREEWTAEVFDVELMRYNNIEEEMVQLLQIAMSCVQIVPDARPSMPDILRMMEEIPRGSGGDTTDDGMLRQSSDDPSKGDTPPIMPSVVTP